MYVKVTAHSPVVAGSPFPPADTAFFQIRFLCHTLVLRAVSGHVSGTWVILNPLPPGPLTPCPQSKQAYDQVLAQALNRYKKVIVFETGSLGLLGGGFRPLTAH